jgi:hypothetical protein
MNWAKESALMARTFLGDHSWSPSQKLVLTTKEEKTFGSEMNTLYGKWAQF